MHYKAVKLVKRPRLTITPDVFEVVTLETSELESGQILLRQTHMSLDPAMRGWIKEGKSYIPPVEIGAVMRAGGVGRVIESNNPDFAVGDHVLGTPGVQSQWLSNG